MMLKQTKIVASISDLRCDVDFIRDLFNAGMNVVRMNTAHASREGFEKLINNVRQVSNRIGILMDTKGPEVRTTASAEGQIDFKTGETVSFLIDYKLAAAATYNYGEHSQPLFDTYDDTKIILHLPEGLSVVEGAAGTLQNVTDVISPEEAGIETNDWVLVMNDSIAAASDSVGTFIVNLAID